MYDCALHCKSTLVSSSVLNSDGMSTGENLILLQTNMATLPPLPFLSQRITLSLTMQLTTTTGVSARPEGTNSPYGGALPGGATAP